MILCELLLLFLYNIVLLYVHDISRHTVCVLDGRALPTQLFILSIHTVLFGEVFTVMVTDALFHAG